MKSLVSYVFFKISLHLNSNLVKNSKIQKGLSNVANIQLWKRRDYRETLYLGVFLVADYDFSIGFSEFRMMNSIWWTLNFEVYLIFPKPFFHGDLESLIANLTFYPQRDPETMT